MTEAQMTNQQKAEAVREYIRHANGSENLYRHAFSGMLYTDGMQFVADTCGAHWLIDAVASHQTDPKIRREPFQVWRLEPHRDDTGATTHWVLDAWSDTPEGRLDDHEEMPSRLLVSQRIEFSDFPEELAMDRWKSPKLSPGKLGFQFWVKDNTALLPCEY